MHAMDATAPWLDAIPGGLRRMETEMRRALIAMFGVYTFVWTMVLLWRG